METFNEFNTLHIRLNESQKLNFAGLKYVTKDDEEINILIINGSSYVCDVHGDIFDYIDEIVDELSVSAEIDLDIIQDPQLFINEINLINAIINKRTYKLNDFINFNNNINPVVYVAEYSFFQVGDEEIYDHFLDYEQLYYLKNHNKTCGFINTGCDYDCMNCEVPHLEPEDCPYCSEDDELYILEAYFKHKRWYCSYCDRPI